MADDERHRRVIADADRIVGDGGVPDEVVARPEFDLCITLFQADAAGQQEVVLVGPLTKAA